MSTASNQEVKDGKFHRQILRVNCVHVPLKIHFDDPNAFVFPIFLADNATNRNVVYVVISTTIDTFQFTTILWMKNMRIAFKTLPQFSMPSNSRDGKPKQTGNMHTSV